MSSKRFLLLVACLGLCLVALPAQDATSPGPGEPEVERESAIQLSLLSTRVTPGVDFTFQSSVRPLYASLAYGADLLGWLPLPFLPLVAPAVGVDYTFVPVQAETSFSSVGLGLGAVLVFDVGRFQITASGLGGGYFSFMNETARDADGTAYPAQSGAAGYASGGVDVSYLLTPYLSLGVGGMYHNMFGLYQGVRAHISATLNLYGLQRHVELRDIQQQPVFPALLQYYGNEPVARAVVTNEEKFPISNIQVEFFAPDYMSAPRVGSELGGLEPGESADVLFGALFTERLLTLTEGSQVSTELTVRYELNGRERETVILDKIRVHHRNALTWDDDKKAAAFVTAKDPEIIRFASAVAGLVRREGPASVNPNLRLGMGMFEALSNYGLSYVIDPNTPAYVDASENTQIVDFLQYPRQTFDFRGGDCDDLSILYTALLESVGVPTAFVTIPGHIFTAFSLGVSTAEARQMFLDDTLFIDRDGEAWMPVEVTLIGEDFQRAWEVGAEQWHDNLANHAVGFYPMAGSWQIYPPSGYPAEGSADARIAVDLPEEANLLREYREQIIQLVQRQLYPQVERLRERINTSRRPVRDLNRLGVLYAQYGLAEEAQRAFDEALDLEEYPPALVNLGNLYYINGDLHAALTHYERAALVIPNEPAVLLSLARINYELERFAQARAYLAQLEREDPDLGERYGYLASADSIEDGGARASDAALQHQQMLWLEEAE